MLYHLGRQVVQVHDITSHPIHKLPVFWVWSLFPYEFSLTGLAVNNVCTLTPSSLNLIYNVVTAIYLSGDFLMRISAPSSFKVFKDCIGLVGASKIFYSSFAYYV